LELKHFAANLCMFHFSMCFLTFRCRNITRSLDQ